MANNMPRATHNLYLQGERLHQNSSSSPDTWGWLQPQGGHPKHPTHPTHPTHTLATTSRGPKDNSHPAYWLQQEAAWAGRLGQEPRASDEHHASHTGSGEGGRKSAAVNQITLNFVVVKDFIVHLYIPLFLTNYKSWIEVNMVRVFFGELLI